MGPARAPARLFTVDPGRYAALVAAKERPDPVSALNSGLKVRSPTSRIPRGGSDAGAEHLLGPAYLLHYIAPREFHPKP